MVLEKYNSMLESPWFLCLVFCLNPEIHVTLRLGLLYIHAYHAKLSAIYHLPASDVDNNSQCRLDSCTLEKRRCSHIGSLQQKTVAWHVCEIFRLILDQFAILVSFLIKIACQYTFVKHSYLSPWHTFIDMEICVLFLIEVPLQRGVLEGPVWNPKKTTTVWSHPPKLSQGTCWGNLSMVCGLRRAKLFQWSSLAGNWFTSHLVTEGSDTVEPF